MLKIHIATINKWIRCYRKQGIEGLKIIKQTGRPKLLKKEKEEGIIKTLNENEEGWTTKEVREIIKKEGGITYTERHVCITLFQDQDLSREKKKRSELLKKSKKSHKNKA